MGHCRKGEVEDAVVVDLGVVTALGLAAFVPGRKPGRALEPDKKLLEKKTGSVSDFSFETSRENHTSLRKDLRIFLCDRQQLYNGRVRPSILLFSHRIGPLAASSRAWRWRGRGLGRRLRRSRRRESGPFVRA